MWVKWGGIALGRVGLEVEIVEMQLTDERRGFSFQVETIGE
jgi:hypothetical protein